ncbi:MAG: beta-galactosidase [Bacteroidota bacterium]
MKVTRFNHGFFYALILFILFSLAANGQDKKRWSNGMSDDPSYFPLAVWLQEPSNATRYQEVGINLYYGLWKGPTKAQITQLEQAGMPVICELNDYAEKHLDKKVFVGWHAMPDEPDNAQPDGEGGYGPCVDPEIIKDNYNKTKVIDPTRPVFLGLGVGIAYPPARLRGSECAGDTLKYYQYTKGADVVHYDIYPVAGPPTMRAKNQLRYVAMGIDNLRRYSNYEKPVWMAMETARIREHGSVPQPYQVEAEIWMVIIHGAKGIVYFPYRMFPDRSATGLLEDEKMKEAITITNSRIKELAPVINSPNIKGVVTYREKWFDQTIDIMVKYYDGAYYIFAVEMYGERFDAKFEVDESIVKGKRVEVLYEDRDIELSDGVFSDSFTQKGGYTYHIYKIDQ